MAAGPGSWCRQELVGFDLETTGVDPFYDLPVSFAFASFVGDTAGSVRRSIVNPGRPIDPSAVAVHGISDAQAAEGLPLVEALELIAGELTALSRRRVPVVGMNVGYDLTLVDSALRRHGLPGLVEQGWCGPVIDVLVIDRHADRWRKGRRNLAALCGHYQVVQVDAHDAAGDAVAAVQVALAIAGRHRWVGTMSPGVLHRAQIAWHKAWVDRRAERLGGADRPFGPWPIGDPPAPVPADAGHEVQAKRADGNSRGHDIPAPPTEPRQPAMTGDPSAWWCEPCHTVFTQYKASCLICNTKMTPLASPDELPPDAGRRMHPEWARATCRHCRESCVVLPGYDGHPNCDPEASAPPPFPLSSKAPKAPGPQSPPAAVTPAA